MQLPGGKRVWIAGGVLLLLVGLAVIPSPSTSVGAFAYEVIGRCPDPRPELDDGGEFLVIGHRGAAGYEVENTIASMERAMESGADAVEVDLSMTSDDRIVLWHDWDPDDLVAIARREGKEPGVLCAPVAPKEESPYYRKTHKLTLEELRTHYGYRLKDSTKASVDATIPTLEDFLAWADGRSDLEVVFFDLKLPIADTALAGEYVGRIRTILEAHAPSFRINYLAAGKPLHRNLVPLLPEGNLAFDAEPPFGLVLSPGEFGSVKEALRTDNRVASHIIPFISTFAPWTTVRRVIEQDMERKMRSDGAIETVIAGTANEVNKWDCLIGLGIDGIITDVPDELRRHVGG